ncbi:glycoside hydrolase family 26 protein [Aquipuribacter nitratireducens]|uniref:Glycoside hydrolase family 26 protein n=1 Tax=Aquipuribacter nitratireducens TaxID=650104 RepID=A0ABW0GQF9_9MICO
MPQSHPSRSRAPGGPRVGVTLLLAVVTVVVTLVATPLTGTLLTSAEAARRLPGATRTAAGGATAATGATEWTTRAVRTTTSVGRKRPAPSPTPSPTPTPTPSPTPTPGPTRMAFGVSVPGGPTAHAELDEVARLVGEQPGIVLSYVDFTRPLPVAELDAVRARGAVPVVTWEPWAAGAGVAQPTYSLARIAGGDHDAHIRAFARDLAAWTTANRQGVRLRFAHEMNGDWYPWAEQVNGNRSGDYVRAWRHVHTLVEASGADVEWVWSPNVPYPGSAPVAGLYPGSAYVDVVALDGYNWGTSQSWSSWQQPQELLGPGLAELRAVAPGTPVLVAETASAEQGGDKAAWAAELVRYLDAQPDVVGLVWFSHDKEADWRIDSSPAVPTALRAALAARQG